MTKSHSCRYALVACMDFRFQEYLDAYVKEKSIDKHGFDRIGVAGGVKNLTFIEEHIEISNRLHKISEVILINHEECGAYGSESTFERHTKDLKTAHKSLTKKFPHLKTTLLYLKLDGEFVEV